MENIERSGSHGRFTDAEIRQKVQQSKAFWSSPAGIQRKAEMEREERSRKVIPARFPDLAKRGGTRPALLGHLSPADQALVARFI